MGFVVFLNSYFLHQSLDIPECLFAIFAAFDSRFGDLKASTDYMQREYVWTVQARCNYKRQFLTVLCAHIMESSDFEVWVLVSAVIKFYNCTSILKYGKLNYIN